MNGEASSSPPNTHIEMIMLNTSMIDCVPSRVSRLGKSFATWCSGHSRVWFSNGDGTFQVSNDLALVDGPYAGWAAHVADLNGDGKEDPSSPKWIANTGEAFGCGSDYLDDAMLKVRGLSPLGNSLNQSLALFAVSFGFDYCQAPPSGNTSPGGGSLLWRTAERYGGGKCLSATEPDELDVALRADLVWPDLWAGGKRVLILLDNSASMLDASLVNVLRKRNMDDATKRRAEKWRQALDTVPVQPIVGRQRRAAGRPWVARSAVKFRRPRGAPAFQGTSMEVKSIVRKGVSSGDLSGGPRWSLGPDRPGTRLGHSHGS